MEGKYELHKIKEGVFIVFYDEMPYSHSSYRYGFIVYTEKKQFYPVRSHQHWPSEHALSKYFTWDENYLYLICQTRNMKSIEYGFDINHKRDISIDELNELCKLHTSILELSPHQREIQMGKEEKKEVKLIFRKIMQC